MAVQLCMHRTERIFVVLLGVVNLLLGGVLLESHRPTGCPSEFHDLCRCGDVKLPDGQVAYVTNCTNTEFTTAEMLHYLPGKTEYLIFTGNDARDLPINLFGNTEANLLHTIDMSNNHIQTIRGKSFHHVNRVRKLILNDNDLYVIGKDFHPRVFSNLVSLEELYLKNAFTNRRDRVTRSELVANLAQTFKDSELSELRILNLNENDMGNVGIGEFFCPLSSLEKLFLADNHMTDFTANISCLPDLQLLDLADNDIPYLRMETLEALEKADDLHVNLTANPFRCDCNMRDMVTWLKRTNLTVIDKNAYRCSDGYPPKIIGRLLLDVQLSEMQCPPLVHIFDKHLSASYAILGIVTVALFLLAVFLIYRNRHEVHLCLLRVSKPVRTKLQYDSLDKRVAEMEV